MSIWDHMRKVEKPPTPRSIDRSPETAGLAVSWDDGPVTHVTLRELRLACPCAVCVDETTGQRVLDPATVAEDVGVAAIEPVGNYAVRLVFTDGHGTGLFDWPLLRRLSK